MRKIILNKGDKFNRLTVVNKVGNKYHCKCQCGNYVDVLPSDIKLGHTKSCGCLFTEKLIERNKKNKTHGMTNSRTYSSWVAMKTRVLNKNHSHYQLYGGGGIKICESWINSFDNFLKDMGERPGGTSLERIDNNGDYCKENCRWATQYEQANNRRNTFYISINGIKKPVSYWAKLKGIGRTTLKHRFNNGWDIGKLFEPIDERFSHK